MDKKNKSNNIIIALLIILVVAIVAVGGYFIIKDVTKRNDNTSSEQAEHKESEKQKEDTNKDSTPSSNTTPSEQTTPANNELEAGITYAEIRGNDFHVEVQVNGQVAGKCDISVLPTDGGQGHHDNDDLEIQNKVSICEEDFSLKGMNRGEHKVTVIINANDGRTKTLEKIVNV